MILIWWWGEFLWRTKTAKDNNKSLHLYIKINQSIEIFFFILNGKLLLLVAFIDSNVLINKKVVESNHFLSPSHLNNKPYFGQAIKRRGYIVNIYKDTTDVFNTHEMANL